jgi:RNA polymerase sigma-70 factor (ECF subfamily)
LGEAAFDRLVRAHRAPLERYARGLGASREDAEEIAATALLRAYQHPPGVRFDQEWRAWLSTVARNLWIDARRLRQLRLVTADWVLEAVPSTTRPVDQIAATAEEARQICAAIALLPPAQRAAIYLREVRGLSYEEIAAELGITQLAVTSTLQRARETVKHHRGGALQALAALSFTPLNSLRRAARAARSASASGISAKVAVPVVLMAGAGSAALAVHPSSAAPHRAPANPSGLTRTAHPATRPTEPASRRAVLAALAARRDAPVSVAPRRDARPSTQRATGRSSAPAAPAATTPANAGVPEAVSSTANTSTSAGTGTGTPDGSPPDRQTKTRPTHRGHKGAPPTRPRAAGNHSSTGSSKAASVRSSKAASIQSSKAAATPSKPPAPAQAKRASTTTAPSTSAAANASAHQANAAPDGPPAANSPANPGDSAAYAAVDAGAAEPDAGAQGAAGGGPEATTPGQAPVTHPPAAHGGNAP